MKPALMTVVGKLRAGITPTVAEYAALLTESGCDQAEVREHSARYRAAIGESEEESAAAEDMVVQLLRGFRLGSRH